MFFNLRTAPLSIRIQAAFLCVAADTLHHERFAGLLVTTAAEVENV